MSGFPFERHSDAIKGFPDSIQKKLAFVYTLAHGHQGERRCAAGGGVGTEGLQLREPSSVILSWLSFCRQHTGQRSIGNGRTVA